MACDRYLDYLSARLDGELAAGEAAELEAHLAACPSCRALAERLDALRDGFAALEEEPAPEGFARGVMDKIRAAEAEQRPVPLFRRPWARALAGLAACLVLGIGVCWGPLRPEPALGQDELPPSLYSRMAPAGSGSTDSADVPAPASLDPSAPLFAVPDLSFENPQYFRVLPSADPADSSARILGSADSLARFLARFRPAQGPENELSVVSGEYGPEFFGENRLLAVTLEEPSGSIGHEVTALTEGSVTIQRQIPEETTADTAAWLILAEVDTSFADGQELEVVLTP